MAVDPIGSTRTLGRAVLAGGIGGIQRYVLHRWSDAGRGDPRLDQVRDRLLATLTGHVLEIGFADGANLSFYPDTITSLTAIDPRPGVARHPRRQVRHAPFPVDIRRTTADALPVKSASYDCVVSTFVLCSVPDVARTLAEVHRVLKPNGRLHFIEHGLSPDQDTARWQERLRRVQRLFGRPCHLTRDITAGIAQSGFEFARLDRYYLGKTPRAAGYLCEGVATKRESA